MKRDRAAATRELIIASSFTADPLLRPASFWLHELELDTRIVLAPYGQLLQQLLDPSGAFANNKHGCNLVLCRVEDWVRDRSTQSLESNVAHLRTTAAEFLAALQTSVDRTSAVTAVFMAPSSSASLARYGGQLEEIERELSMRLSAIDRLHCWTHADLMRLYPVADREDPTTDELAHIPYTQAYFTALATLLARRLAALFKPRWKVIAVDCDNTLWKGVCGEDGVEGIELTQAHLRFQRALIQQHDAGMLLCLCTKNNPRDVEAVFERRKDMLLQREHLVASRVNWAPKSSNLRALADELDLGLDSFIFIDDSALECADVREHCPSVLTLQMPGTAAQITHFIDHVWAFDRVGVTEEAARRTAQYKENRERSKALAEAGELETFLASLNLEVSVEPMLPAHVARVAELTQRTNQFNLTTIRRTASDIEALCRTAGVQVLVAHVRDRFGDYGLVGMVVLREQATALEVDTFLLSCRALGRGVEFRIVNEIGRRARRIGVSDIVLRYRATQRNVPARTFVHGSFAGFRAAAANAEDDEEVYLLPVDVAVQLHGAVQAAPVEQESARPVTQGTKEQPSYRWHEAALALSRMTDLLRAIQSSARRIRRVANPCVAPSTPSEQAVAAIWAEALCIDAVGVTDDFFELGGDSLLAVQVVARIGAAMNRELPLHEFFAAPTVAQVSVRLLEAPPSDRAIQQVAADALHPLSSAQLGMWLVDRIEGGGSAYHLPVALKLHGALDVRALQDALDDLVVRHESLRTVFSNHGEPAQQVLAAAGLKLCTQEVQAEQVPRCIQEQLCIPFDLEAGPLIRASLLRISSSDHVLLLIMHHIVSDGWSVGVMVGELLSLYQARRGEALKPAPLEVHYRDYAHWQQQWLLQDHIQQQRKHWEGLRDAPDLLELPTDRPRPAIRSYRGATLGVALDARFTAELRNFSRHQGLTPAMVLYATWFMLMSRLSGQDDIVVGVPVAGRRRAELEGLIGLFVNTLAVRVRVDQQAPVRDLLASVRHSLLDAYSNQDVPFEQVVEAVRPTRSASHNALFQTMLVLQGTPRRRERIGDLEVIEQDVPLATAKFDLTLSLQASGDELVGHLNYATDLFDAATVERWMEAFKVLLRAVVETPERRVSRLPLMGEDGHRQVLVDFNRARTASPSERLLHRIFEQQTARTPGTAAVVFEQTTLTFAELNAKANRLARHLHSRDVGPGDLVALCVERGVEMVVGILGAWKAGAAYVPLDPDYPRERLQQILEDSVPKALLIQQRLRTHVPPSSALLVDLDAPELERFDTDNLGDHAAMRSDQLAYVIYTSGSTGRPKGVMVEHRQVINLWHALEQEIYEQSPACRRIAVNASFNFDASVKQFVQLLSGRTLVLIPQQSRWNAPMLLQLLQRQQVEGIDCTPMQLQSWLDAGLLSQPGTLRVVLIGGEPIDAALWKRLSGSRVIAFHNVYGPTECTVDATVARVNGDGGSPHIGRPLPNTSIYILDRHGEPVLIGMPGELHIGGGGVGRGYLRRPALTAERFVADSFAAASGRRMYKTGDLARWRSDGTIEYLGRNDHQVKLRGYRIELGEIETHLTRHPAVKAAAVLVREDAPGRQRLVAYVVASTEPGAPLDVDSLRRRLKATLPEYMVPSAFVALDRLPQTVNGKLDRRALPAPDGETQLAAGHEAAQGDTEQMVACIWQQLLQMERVGRDDNFFDLGGHSLLIMEVAASIQERLGIEVPLRLLFEAATVKQLALELEQLRKMQALQRVAGPEASVDELLKKLAELPESEVESLLREMDMEERA